MNTSLLLRGADIILPHGVLLRGSLFIEQGRISSVRPEGNNQKADATLDLDGLSLFPGYIDVHIHGAMGVDVLEATAEDLGNVSSFLATQGVTGWLPTFVPAQGSDYERAVAAIEESIKTNDGARILGVHYEGPFVNSRQCGALRSRFFRGFSGPKDIDDLPVIPNSGFKHMMTVAPEIDGGLELVRELKRRGWIVSIGHTQAGFELLEQAFEAGARHMTHFMNAMTPMHHRSAGPVTWGLSRDDVTCDVIADGVHVERHTLQLLLKLKGVDRLSLISDAVSPAGMGDGVYKIWGEAITVEHGRSRNERGNIAGSVSTMLDAVRIMRSLGVTDVAIAKMASSNPARLLGMEQECGSIEEGKRADLIAVDAAGDVQLTVISGRIVVK